MHSFLTRKVLLLDDVLGSASRSLRCYYVVSDKSFPVFLVLEAVFLAFSPIPSPVLSNKNYFSRGLVIFVSQLYRPETLNCRGGSAVGESSAEPGESAGGVGREGSRADAPSGPGAGKRGHPSPPPRGAASWKLG